MESSLVSAYSMYMRKRKSTEQLSNEKKKKKKQKDSNKKQKCGQTNVKQQVQCKEEKESSKKLNSVNNKILLANDIDNIKNMHRKLKLKAVKLQKKESKDSADKIETVQITNAVAEEKESSKKLNNSVNNKILLANDTDNTKNMHRKLKLKAVKLQKKESNDSADKTETVQITNAVFTKNVRTESIKDILNNTNSSHLNDVSTETNEESANYCDPIKSSRELLEWLLEPITIEAFFKNNWEKSPVYVKRGIPDYYKFVVSTPLLDQMLRKNHILFTKNIDITSYSDGVRETHNPSGRAFPSVVWDYYQNKCSVRMLNPQTYLPQIHAINATLQEFFGCFVGANLYLTPPNSQGFAPHYDDVEAFILQIEGQKRWRLYTPLNENEYLPRYSSRNFDQSEIGEPILDTVVKAGDLLYLPRGTIHQGMTLENTHSLHVTLSVYQKNSWCDLLEKLLPQALQKATENNIRFRQGLPLDYLKYVGTAYNANDKKDVFKNDIKNLITLLLEHIDIDEAADLMAKSHTHDFLPPFILKEERKCTVVEDGEVMTKNGLVKNCVEFTLETRIRLLRSHCVRLVKEDVYTIYYSTENSKEYHEYEPQFIEVDEEFVPGIKQMIISYPDFISVNELPIENDDAKIQIVKDLWEKGLIITENPLC